MILLKNFTCLISRASFPLYGIGCSFSSKKIDDLVMELSDRIHREQIVKAESEENILKNYIELTEESYLEHLLREMKEVQEKKGKIDPRVILMILPTLQKAETIKEHLLALYPHLNLLKNKELQLFFEYLLAHPLPNKPKVPAAKSLIHAQSLLVLLGEIYPKDVLTDWLAQVPLYTGPNLYLLAMGAFSIISGLSESGKLKNQQIIKRSYQRIFELWQHQNSEGRIGVILLGLECGLPFSEELLLQDYALEFEDIDGLKLGLLIVELDGYIKSQYGDIAAKGPVQKGEEQDDEMEDVEVDEGIDRVQRPPAVQRYVYNPSNTPEVKFHLQRYLYKLIAFYRKLDWTGIVKLHQMVRFYSVLKGKTIEKEWQMFAFKLFSFTTKKSTATSLVNLSTEQILGMLEVVESHKMNKPDLIKQLLVVLSDRLEEAPPEEMVRLSKCLITYVRLCEDYLIHFRVILERRKYIFNYQQIQQLNQYFRRVQVLFPKPLVY